MGTHIKNLINLSCPGIFALVNSKKKRVYINFSKNMLLYVSRVLGEIHENTYQYRNMIEDLDELELEVLEARCDIETLEYWFSRYGNEGWEIYNAGAKRPLARSPRVVISNIDKSIVEARLYNRRNDYEVVGVFNNVPEAESFLESCYGDNNPFKYKIFAANFLTRKELTQ